MSVSVTIEVNNSFSKIVDRLPADINSLLKQEMSFVITGSEFSEYARFGSWDGTKYLYNEKTQEFPTGLLNRARNVFSRAGYLVKLVDARVPPKLGKKISLKGIELRDYQQDCVDTLVSRTRGLIQVGTGAGKCFRWDQLVLMHDWKTKQIKDIVPGDKVMGIDGNPRTVESVHSGIDFLYKLMYGKSEYFITKNHTLTLMASKDLHILGKDYLKGSFVDIDTTDYLKLDTSTKSLLKGIYIESFNPVKYRLSDVSIEPSDKQVYYGFSILEDDKHFLLGDKSVAHNSVIIGGVLANLNVKSLIIVPTTELLHQTAESLHKQLGKKIGMIGDSIRDIQKITVSTFQSLTTSIDVKKKKYIPSKFKWTTVISKKVVIRPDLKDYLNSVECLYVDESHHISSESIQQVFNACPNAYFRYGCSATPFHDKDEDVLIEASTGKVLKVYSASFLIKNGWLSRPTIHLIPFKQNRGGTSDKYSELYAEKIVNNSRRNELLVDIIKSRADMGDSVLVSVRYLDHGKILYDMLVDTYGDDVVFVNSKMQTKKLNETLKRLSNKEIKICIGTSLINEGVNLPSLNTLVLAGTPKSKIATMQLVGRVLRKTKDKSTVDVYDIQDYNTKYFTGASKERLNIYAQEEEFVIKEDNSFNKLLDK